MNARHPRLTLGSLALGGLLLGSTLSVAPAFAEDPPLAIPGDGDGPPPVVVTPSQPENQPLAIPGPQNAPRTGPVLGDRTYQQGYTDGKGAGQREPMGGWFGVGAMGGCAANWVGCLAASGTAAIMEPRYNPATYENSGETAQQDYWAGYREGYSKTVRSRRAKAAFIGGTVTSAAAIVIVGALYTGVLFTPIYID